VLLSPGVTSFLLEDSLLQEELRAGHHVLDSTSLRKKKIPLKRQFKIAIIAHFWFEN